MTPTVVRYDLLPPGAHTVLPIDHQPPVFDPGLGFNAIDGWERMDLGALAEVADVNDPKSFRAYQVRGHLYGFGSQDRDEAGKLPFGSQAPLCSLVSGPTPTVAQAIPQDDSALLDNRPPVGQGDPPQET